MQTINTLDAFTLAYLECALWASMDETDENTGGEPLDANYTFEDIAPETLQEMVTDCVKFQELHGVPCYNSPQWTDAELSGHDFWLTRNHHGCGFWDRTELSETDQTRLTNAAHEFGEYYLYLGDDGLIYGYKGQKR